MFEYIPITMLRKDDPLRMLHIGDRIVVLDNLVWWFSSHYTPSITRGYAFKITYVKAKMTVTNTGELVIF